MAWMGAAGARAMPNMIYNVNPFKYADLKDRVAGNTLSVLRSGSLVAEQKDGTFKSFAANTPAIGAWGVMSDGAGTQYFVVPETPVTQTISLGTGDYDLWVAGSGSAAIAAGTATITGAGTATEGSDVPITVTGAGTVVVTVTGTLTWCQLESGTFPTSRIFNASGTTSRATQAGSTTNGLYIANADLDSRVIPSLSAEGTSITGFRFEYPETLHVTAGLIGFNDNYNSFLRRGWNKDINFRDETNNIVNSNGWARGITAFIAARHKASTVSMGLYISKDNGINWVTTNGTFDGTFPYNDTLRYFFGNGYQSWMLFHQMYDGELTDAEIEAAVADAMEPLSGANFGLIRPLISDLISDIIRPIIG